MRSLAGVALSLAVACAAPPATPTTQAAFALWLAAEEGRAQSFARFEALLEEEGVSGVVPNFQLWRVDRLNPSCRADAFAAPPEGLWLNIVPPLRILRDEIEPALGNVQIVSAYRDSSFNECIGGAQASKHRDFSALDLTPVGVVAHAQMVESLCRVHAREGARLRIGLGLYDGARFHVDARGFRGWGSDHRAATFPCDRN